MSSTHKEGRKPIYDSSLKIAVARDYITSNLGYGKIAEKYDLPSPGTARHIVRWYRGNYPDNVIEQQIPVPDNPVSAVTVIKELKEAQLKITALEMFIEIAGKELGVDLQKKFGTKLSKK